MSRRLKLLSAAGLLFAVAACTQRWDPPAGDLERPPAARVNSQRTPAMGQGDVLRLLAESQFATLDRHFSNVQRDYVDGLISDEELRNAFRVFYATDEALESKYDAWVDQFPQSYVAHLARGIYLKRVGRSRRGSDYIQKTSFVQLLGMSFAYARAAREFHASAKLNGRPLLTYMHAMDISTQDGDAAETRRLLDLSVDVDPTNFIVRQKYMISLEPRWGGSMREMHAFLDECRRANLPQARLRKLAAVIAADQAFTDYEWRHYAAAASEYREAIQMGGETPCLPCAAYAMTATKQYADAVKVYSLILAANPADVDSLTWRGYAYAELQDPRAVADLTAAANLGNTYSQNLLGRYSLEGVPGIVPQDRAAAIRWFRKASAAGDPEGVRNLKAALAAAPSDIRSRSSAQKQ